MLLLPRTSSPRLPRRFRPRTRTRSFRSLSLRILFVACIVVVVALTGVTQTTTAPTEPPPGTTAGCSGITVDLFGLPDSTEYRYFLLQVQKAVQSDNRRQLAGDMVQYPMLWNHDGQLDTIHNTKELLKSYDAVFTPVIRQKVAHQSLKCLEASEMSASIGGGAVQFTRTGSGAFKIITVNGPRMQRTTAALGN